MTGSDEARTSQRKPSSTWLFPRRYDGALGRLADVAKRADRFDRARALEEIVLDILNHEHITSSHRLEGRSLGIQFELGSHGYEVVCAWDDRGSFDVVARSGRTTVLVVMGRPPVSLGDRKTIVVGYDVVLRVLEGRTTWRKEIEDAQKVL